MAQEVESCPLGLGALSPLPQPDADPTLGDIVVRLFKNIIQNSLLLGIAGHINKI